MLHSRVASFARPLLRCHQGNVAMLFALAIVPVVLAGGMAIDIGRAYSAKVQLASALDAAGLAAGSSTGADTALQQRMQQFFAKNYPPTAAGTPSTPTMSTDSTGNVITVSGSTTVNTAFMKLVGIRTVTVNASSQITKQTKGLELAMALDNTGSMLSNNNIQALRDAATELTQILFGTDPSTGNTKASSPNLKIAVVPYVTTVNPGPLAPTLLPTSYTLPAKYDTAGTDPTKWQGCLMEPAYPADIQETTTQWPKAYWWPSAQDNYWPSSSKIQITHGSSCNTSASPNNACPTPVTRLTNQSQTILDSVAAMQAWCRSGTMIHVGLAWGWRAISPVGPFKDGLPYNTTGWEKALVLMTDGVNENFRGPNEQFTNQSNPFKSDYTPYGRLDDGMIGANVTSPGSPGATTQSSAVNYLNTEEQKVCDAIKAQGITIYTVAFTSSATQASKDILAACASDPGKFFDAPTQDDLKRAFRAIANSLNNLRVSK